jgi:hypothetical protein
VDPPAVHVTCEAVVGVEPAGVLTLVLRGQPVRQGTIGRAAHLTPGFPLVHAADLPTITDRLRHRRGA